MRSSNRVLAELADRSCSWPADIQKYADGSARSKVGNAVRRGVAAHEFDDDLDDHGVAERPKPAAS